MLPGLAKAYARVQDDLAVSHTGFLRHLRPLQQERPYFFHHVLVDRCLLHGLGGTLHMHQNQGHVPVSREPQYVLVFPSAGDIVDHGGAGLQRRVGDLRQRGIDADRNPLREGVPQTLYDRQHTVLLPGRRDSLGTRARGFPAHVYDIRALLHHGGGVPDGGVGIQKTAAVGKAVRRHVQDAHDDRLV